MNNHEIADLLQSRLGLTADVQVIPVKVKGACISGDTFLQRYGDNSKSRGWR